MKNIKSYIVFLVALGTSLSSCKKDGENIFNMFDVAVEFHGDKPYSVTGYKEVMDGDSVYIDFTMKSPDMDMYTACLLEAGTSSPLVKIPIGESGRRSFSHTIKLKADKKIGPTTYRVYALDSRGIYMGDGYKTITVDVKSNFTYYTERYLSFPFVSASFPNVANDSTKALKSYLSLTTGETFNYVEGAKNSAKIDLGVYRYFPPVVPPATVSQGVYRIYSLSAADNPVSMHDISSWTKRETLFSAPKTKGKDAFDKLKTGTQIEAAAKKETINKTGPIDVLSDNIVYFKTPEGKYGALCIVSFDFNRSGGLFSNVSANVQVKILD